MPKRKTDNLLNIRYILYITQRIMSTKSGILSVFSGTYQVTQKGAVSTLPQLRFQHCFLFSFAFYRNRNSRRGNAQNSSRRTYRSILTRGLGNFSGLYRFALR